MIDVEGLTKDYGARRAIDNLTFNAQKGEILGFLGPNGAGKTTSFYMMVGLIKADTGDITLDHHTITDHPMHLRARLGIGYLPQEPSIFRKLSVVDNLRAVLQIRSDLTHGQMEMVIEELLEEFHIPHLRNQLAMSLSGGERRRLEIARALATNPQFILLDEPFAGVDPISVEDIKKIIEQLKNRNIGVLITEHNVRETLGICDRAYILNQGQVIAEGGANAIVANEQVRNVYLGNNFSL